MGVSQNGGTPSHHPFFVGVSEKRNVHIFGYPHDYGNPHITRHCSGDTTNNRIEMGHSSRGDDGNTMDATSMVINPLGIEILIYMADDVF